MKGVLAIVPKTLRAFYDGQMTHHAAALTYYGLMSLFPAALIALSLLGLIGEYPRTYNAIMGYLRDVAPASVVAPLDSSLRQAFQSEGTAITALAVSVITALYGTTGVLEAMRRAMNVAFGVRAGRGFVRRKAIDVGSSIVLTVLVLSSLVFVFVGGSFADDMFEQIGLGGAGAKVWSLVRWPAAMGAAMLGFAYVYYVTPDREHRSFRWITPGAVLGVLLWLGASYGFSSYLSRFPDVGALYGAFTGAVLLVAWLWLSNCALLFGAVLNAEIDRQVGPRRRRARREPVGRAG
jgi:membrane protein